MRELQRVGHTYFEYNHAGVQLNICYIYRSGANYDTFFSDRGMFDQIKSYSYPSEKPY